MLSKVGSFMRSCPTMVGAAVVGAVAIGNSLFQRISLNAALEAAQEGAKVAFDWSAKTVQAYPITNATGLALSTACVAKNLYNQPITKKQFVNKFVSQVGVAALLQLGMQCYAQVDSKLGLGVVMLHAGAGVILLSCLTEIFKENHSPIKTTLSNKAKIPPVTNSPSPATIEALAEATAQPTTSAPVPPKAASVSTAQPATADKSNKTAGGQIKEDIFGLENPKAQAVYAESFKHLQAASKNLQEMNQAQEKTIKLFQEERILTAAENKKGGLAPLPRDKDFCEKYNKEIEEVMKRLPAAREEFSKRMKEEQRQIEASLMKEVEKFAVSELRTSGGLEIPDDLMKRIIEDSNENSMLLFSELLDRTSKVPSSSQKATAPAA